MREACHFLVAKSHVTISCHTALPLCLSAPCLHPQFFMPQKRHAASGLGVAAVIVQSVEEEFSEVLGMCDTLVRLLVSCPGGPGVFFACQPCLVIIVPASHFTPESYTSLHTFSPCHPYFFDLRPVENDAF
jgi:hypothetical protein